MRHLKKVKKFHRTTGQRKAFIKSLSSNLILKGRINTTETRGKAIKSVVEKMVTLAKKQNLNSLRLLISRVGKPAAMKLYNDIAPKYKGKNGGYMRVIKVSKARKGDAAPMVYVEFI